jgi:ribosomal protein L13E
LSTKPKKAKPAGKRKESAPKAPKTERPKVERPAGRVPGAAISTRHGIGMIERSAKGFSRSELSEGGLPIGLALKWHVPVDLRRRSTVAANVAAVKKWYVQPKSSGAAAPQKPQPAATRKKAPKKRE